MPRKVLRCSKCDRSFKMPAHLARHMSSTHGFKKKRAVVKKAKKRSTGRRAKKRARRLSGSTTRLGLSGMSLEQLTQLIDAARGEARRKLSALDSLIG